MGWRTGKLFVLPATKVTLLSGCIAVGLILHVVAGALTGGLSLWWLLILPAAAFGGGALITGVFRQNTGLISLICSPVTFAVAGYFYANGQ